MQGQMSFNEQVAEFQDQTSKAIGDILDQLTLLTQTLSVSEPDEFPTQPNQNSIGQCLGEELSSSDTILEEEAGDGETCKDIIDLSKFEPKLLSFRLVYVGDQIKPDMCEVFVQINMPHSDVIDPIPLSSTFSKDGRAFIRKIQLHHFENSVISGLKHVTIAVI